MSSLLVTVGADINELKSKMSEAHGLIHNFTEQVAEIGKGLLAAFAVEKIVEWGKVAVEEAGKAIDNENRLLFALKGRREIQEDLLSQAELLAHKTLFDDDEIVKQQTLLAVMGRSDTQIQSLIAAAIDFKSALGPDVGLGQVVEALNKALEGNNKALFSLDPTLRSITELHKGHGDAVAYVSEKYKGFAEEMAKSGSGPMSQFAKQWEDIQKNLGRKILPEINSLLQNFSDQLVVWGDKNTPLWEKIFTGKEGYHELRQGIDKSAEIESARKAWDKEMEVLKSMAAGLLPGIDIVATRLETIKSIQEKISELKEKEADASGKELTNIQAQMIHENKKLEVLQKQYQAILDAAKEAEKIQKRADLINLQNTLGPDTKQADLQHMAASKLVANSENGGMQDFLTGEMDTSGPKDNKALEDYYKRMKEMIKGVNTEMAEMSKLGDMAAHSLVGAFKSVIDGTQTAAQALGSFVENFGLEMLSMALMGIIATAMHPSSNSGNYYVALALAGAGMAAVGAMFAKAGMHGGGSAAGVAGGNGESFATSSKVISSSLGSGVNLNVRFEPINGNQLQAVLVNQSRIDGKVTGG